METDLGAWLLAGALLLVLLLLLIIRSEPIKVKTLKTFGDYPPELLRFFGKREHAEQFLAGSVRFGLLDYYKGIEDKARKDAAEGAGSFTAPAESVTTVTFNADGEVVKVSEAPGDVHHHVDFGNPTYIVSCVDSRSADIGQLKEKFGPYVVRITNPIRLGQDLTNKLSELDVTHPLAGGVVECAKVDYDKGQRRENEQGQEERLKAAYAQKPAEFSDECECRLVIFRRHPVTRGESESDVVVELDGPLEYADFLEEE